MLIYIVHLLFSHLCVLHQVFLSLMFGMNFYINSTDFLPKEYSDIVWDLEGEYETILRFGRDLLELDSSHLLKNSNIKEIERIPIIFRPELKKTTYYVFI